MFRRGPMTSRSDLEPRKGEGGEKVAKTEIATFPKKQDTLSSLLLIKSIAWEKVAAIFGALPSQPPVLVGDSARFLKCGGSFSESLVPSSPAQIRGGSTWGIH